jgi:type VI secretion system secreted protein VgrG
MSASDAQFTFEFLDVDYEVSVLSFNAVENISHLSGTTLMLVSEQVIPCKEVVRQEGVLTIINPEGIGNPDRYIHGILRKFRHAGMNGRFHIYEAHLVPSLWLLSLKQDCRIFQDMKLQDIIRKILEESDITSDLYEFRLEHEDIFNKFNIQYNETDLHFISRLLEKEGIFYFFEHYEDKHVVVFCDSNAFYQDIEGDTSIQFNSGGGMVSANAISISSFDYSVRMRPSAHTHTNFNFKKPSVKLETTFEGENHNPDEPFEIYSYPGSYGEPVRGDRLAQIRMETMAALKEKGRGVSNCTRLTSGATFQLTGHRNQEFNQEYFLFGVTHGGKQPGVLKEQAPKDATPGYSNAFMVIPSSVTYRPEQRHEKPMVPGLLSAVVTGPKGEEIWPDQYGRVNVQFHFDREGKMDEKSSCWLRTIQFWNGTTWGSQFIPRIGDEVLVTFVNGDMDYPIIMGSAINEAKLPNYNLPANKTQSGIRTRSTPGGNPDNYNELRFEDKKGAEEVFLQGEKDWNILIKNDKGQYVGNDETLNVRNNRTKTVGVDQSESIGANKTINVGVNHVETIGSNMNLSVGNCKTEFVAINTAETIGAAKELSIGGAYAITVGGAMNTAVGLGQFEEVGLSKKIVVGKRFDISSGDKFEIICGKSKISMDSAGNIIISGSNIDISGSGNITMKGQKVKTNG